MNPVGVFITGTDTSVGKTWFGTALCRHWFRDGIRVAPRKPVESGCSVSTGALLPEDGLAYHRAVETSVDLDVITRYRLRHAISPERAALLEDQHIDLTMLENAVLAELAVSSVLVVEGAGGFYSPLTADGLNADLAERLALPLIVVAPDRLGVISQVLLTLEAAAGRDLEVLAVILNQPDTGISADDGMDNLQDLSKRVPCPLFRTQHGVATNIDSEIATSVLRQLQH